MKKTLLTAALMVATALTASAQYRIDSTLAVPKAAPATDVDDYGFTANWIPLTEDEQIHSKSLGYYIPVYAVKTAKEEGEKFYFINTDFSFLKSQYTVDNPYSDISMKNSIVRGDLNEPHRPCGWTILNAGQADGVLCLDCKLNKVLCNSAIALCYNDLTKGDGIVHVKFKVRGDGNVQNMAVYLRNVKPFPNEVIEKHVITGLTTEWQEVELTLKGGVEMGDILIQCEDQGNIDSMFLFIDDLQVWQELHKGETVRIQYGEDVVKDDLEASSLYFTKGDLYEGEEFGYAACTYSIEAHSPESDMVLVDAAETAINKTKAITDASTPVTVYNLSGSVVAAGTVGNMPALPKGVLIVKTGDKARKVVVK